MNSIVLASTKIALALVFASTVLTEALFLPLGLGEVGAAYPEVAPFIAPAFIGAALVLLCVQTMIVITWMLASLSQDERIFSARALRLVTALTALPFIAFALLAVGFVALNVLGFAQPGVIYLLLGASTVALAVGFILITMRALLIRSITLHTELSEVV